ncbi:MAG: hypothetical protein J6V21_00875 [Alistipes sp.]|nr:hypothetical protein [Alistipes sp.]
MVTIDDNGNKVNCWVEHRFDTTTNEVVEVKHATILAEADDEEHWLSRTIYEPMPIEESLSFGNIFIYAPEEVEKSIEKLVAAMRLLSGSHHRLAKEIPMPQLMRALTGESDCEGLILEATMIHTDLLALLVDCRVESAEALCDALFDIFPNIDYIEIVY